MRLAHARARAPPRAQEVLSTGRPWPDFGGCAAEGASAEALRSTRGPCASNMWVRANCKATCGLCDLTLREAIELSPRAALRAARAAATARGPPPDREGHEHGRGVGRGKAKGKGRGLARELVRQLAGKAKGKGKGQADARSARRAANAKRRLGLVKGPPEADIPSVDDGTYV